MTKKTGTEIAGALQHPLTDWLQAVLKERQRQDKKHGGGKPQYHTLPEWILILGEERGEVDREANEVHFRDKPADDLLKELIEEIAVALAIYEAVTEGRVYRHGKEIT